MERYRLCDRYGLNTLQRCCVLGLVSLKTCKQHGIPQKFESRLVWLSYDENLQRLCHIIGANMQRLEQRLARKLVTVVYDAAKEDTMRRMNGQKFLEERFFAAQRLITDYLVCRASYSFLDTGVRVFEEKRTLMLNIVVRPRIPLPEAPIISSLDIDTNYLPRIANTSLHELFSVSCEPDHRRLEIDLYLNKACPLNVNRRNTRFYLDEIERETGISGPSSDKKTAYMNQRLLANYWCNRRHNDNQCYIQDAHWWRVVGRVKIVERQIGKKYRLPDDVLGIVNSFLGYS